MQYHYNVTPESSQPRAGEQGPGAGPPAGPVGALYGPAPGTVAQMQMGFAYTAPKVLYNGFKARQALAMGVTQICAGILCAIFNAIAIRANSEVAFAGCGIWGGLMCVIAGILGVCAANSKTKCKVVAYMVLCILAAVMCLGIALSGVFGSLFAGLPWQDPENYMHCGSYSNQMEHFGRPCPTAPPSRKAVRLSMNVLLILLAVLEAVVSIWGSTLCCKVACCGQSEPIMIPVQFIQTQSTAQFVVMTPPQQGGGPLVVQPAADSSYQPAAFSTAMQGDYEGAVGGHFSASGGASPPPMYTAQHPQYNEDKVALL